MVRRVSTSQLRSKLRQAQAKQKQAVDRYNRAAREHDRKVRSAVSSYNQAVSQYNAKARAHNSRVRANRNRLRRELEKLASAASRPSYTTFRASVETVQQTYVRLESAAGTYGHEYSDVLDLSEREAANNASVMNAILGDPEASGKESILSTTLDPILASMGADLSNRWHGALFSLSPDNPDAARHFCTSAREVLTRILDSCAPSTTVLAEMPHCEKAPNGFPTRRAKIRFFLHRGNKTERPLEDFVEEDMKNILQLFREFNDGTHGTAGRFSLDQLAAIKTRVEDAVEFLWSIIPDDLRPMNGSG